MIDGFGGSFIEAHALDDKLAKRIPKRMIGRTLTLDEAAASARTAMTRPSTRAVLRQPVVLTLEGHVENGVRARLKCF